MGIGRREDAFGNGLSGDDTSVAAWRQAVDELLSFTGDPITTLDPMNRSDDRFVMGPVFAVAYRLLGGVAPTDPAVLADTQRLERRAPGATDRERAHIAAVTELAGGEFERAAEHWDQIAVVHPRDLTALKLAHDVCLHIGEDRIRLDGARRTIDTSAFADLEPASGIIHGMLAFALEEVGRYEEAEDHGRRALEVEPGDLWARHALAHVYESTGNHHQAIELLVPTTARWSQQNLLANHIWWHVGLRHLHHGDTDDAVSVLDRHLVSTTSFGLADSTSLLWRIELVAGREDADGRWPKLAKDWAAKAERYTSGFLDVHAAMAFAAAPGPGADDFCRGLHTRPTEAGTFNDVTFAAVVRPAAQAMADYRRGDMCRAVETLGQIDGMLPRIGGSVVQREIVGRTAARAAELLGADR